MNTIRSITERDRKVFNQCFLSAFIADPFLRFVWPRLPDYFQHFENFFSIYCGSAVEDGTARVIGDFHGCSAWLAPGRSQDGEALKQYMVEHAEQSHVDDLLASKHQIEQDQPDEPHWYLPFLGVDPLFWKQGLGKRLLVDKLQQIDESGGAPVFLESSNLKNVSLYLGCGFERLSKINLGGHHVVTTMVRAPRQA